MSGAPLLLTVFAIEADRKLTLTFTAKDAETFFKDDRIRTWLQLTTGGGRHHRRAFGLACSGGQCP